MQKGLGTGEVQYECIFLSYASLITNFKEKIATHITCS